MFQRRFCTLVALLVVAASPVTAHSLDQVTLDSNRAQWESQNLSNYDLVQGIGCFCPSDFPGPALVSVRQDTIVSIVDVHTLEPSRPANFLTIDWMFDTLQFALDSGEFWIDAQFDDRLGYPSYFKIDGAAGDDDYSYRVYSLTAVPEPASIRLGAIAFTLLGRKRTSRGSAVL